MLSRKFLLIIVTIFTFHIKFAFAQTYEYKNLTFQHLSIEHGLSQITVHSILEDNKGFLWFGTEDGLNRYDGYEFVVYRNNPNDPNSISDNFVWSIFEDSEKNIWVGTNNGGLNKYDYSTNSFTTYLNNSKSGENNIRVIFEDSKQNLWVGTNSAGVFKLDKNNNKFVKALENLDNFSIRAISEDSYNTIWIGTDVNGLFGYNYENNETTHYSTSNSRITSNSIWALTSDKHSKSTNTFTSFVNNDIGNRPIDNNITSLAIDNNDNIWIATEGGLSIYLTEKNEFINYKHSLSDIRSLSNSFLRVILKSKSNLIWIGTVGGGVNKLNLNKKFNQFNHNPTDENSLSHNMIRAIEGDSRGNIWIFRSEWCR